MSKLSSIIHKTLESTNQHRIPKSYNPSSAGFKYSDGTVIGPDILDSFLKYTGVKPSNPPDGAALLRMRLGDAAHEALAKIFEASGFKVMTETSFKYSVPGLSLPISGRTDFIIEFDGRAEVIEVKSVMSHALTGKGWGIRDKGPKLEHQLQGICYFAVPGIQRVRFLYIARDSGETAEFVMEKTGTDQYAIDGRAVRELSMAGIIARWQEVDNAVKSGVRPLPDYRPWINEKTGEVQEIKTINGEKYKTPWQIIYSNYRDMIWKDPEMRKYAMKESDILQGAK